MGKLSPILKKIDKALDMREAARMKRAEEMGFDTSQTYYHGTAGDIDAFDPEKLGATTGARSAKKGYFFTADPDTADAYAEIAQDATDTNLWSILDKQQGPEGRKLMDAYKAGDFQALLDAFPDGRYNDKIKAAMNGAPNVMPVHVRHKNPKIWDAEGKAYKEAFGRGGLSDVINQAKVEGHDALIMKNFDDHPYVGKSPQDHVVTFDPSNIRSVNAAFDPAKKDSSNLLAGLGSAGIVGGAALGSEDAEASFIGKTARTFSEKALKLAEDMSAQGAHRDDIWKATGEQFGAPTMKGADGQWRQEISDAGAGIDQYGLSASQRFQGGSSLDGVINHPSLYEAYPSIANTKLTVKDLDGAKGSFNPISGRIALDESLVGDPEKTLSTGLHETQHAIQEIEGFGRGTNTDTGRIAIERAFKDKSLANSDATFYKARHESNLADAGYNRSVDLSNTAWRLEEIDRLEGYLADYRNGGKLTDKRRHILNSGGAVLDHNVEYNMRTSMPWSKKHRPQDERDAQYAHYIENVVREAKKELDPDLVSVVRSEKVKNPHAKYQRQARAARKTAEDSHYYQQLRATQKKDRDIGRFLDNVNADSRYAPQSFYRKSAGEVESRTVQERLPLSLDERIQSPPWKGSEWRDTPIEKQIVLGNRGQVKNYGLAGLGGAGILGASMLTPEQAAAADSFAAQNNDGIYADEFPTLEKIGGYLQNVETPIPLFQKPFEGLGTYLRRFGEPRSLSQRIMEAIDAPPI